ncbi:GTP diphosphokinase / guanosine-3',5'-bis(diphosphate) 3'-diphosphatase [Nitratiruptor sp. YY08-26]|uniref:RelA/SpoT family protein n=1 Tax=unclassified Nitratiruptor TaxID=2624044 RepID=UPI001915C98D|nr:MULTISPECIES: RelA/SpoT family protein [unclassified Nitratiruptor]BCD62110.1 GTP diphosphokinase / guanosine-3',5'-bis(diphosphate) 3'-diphosphatase [Nitratiruptor sp. YY08-13]BCD66046.1 GTP diphosphokinase / guanosine-3',5'-bis(diphosphate) 3'-diphosphatase [Nitratiruptor sp. YY08-26]
MKELIDKIKNIKSVEEAQKLLFGLYPPTKKVQKALQFAKDAHEGQYRKSGEPYIIHPILVAAITAFITNDETMIISALLHDVVEDTPHSIEEIEDLFGKDVASLVEGLTKIVAIRSEELIPSHSNEKLITSALSFRKMLIASIEDVRVLIVKLCDRLHNMLTLDALPEAKQKRIAEETLVVYAPIAHRLGIASIKNYLEDLSFYYLFPQEYERIDQFIRSHKLELQMKLNEFIDVVKKKMVQNGFRIDDFEILSRIKHYYSIYLKMQRKGISIEEVLDLLAIRILVKEKLACYKVLGVIHTNFKPLVMRFKDYIAVPKENGYQTIHTTVFDNSSIFEVQIRTFKMHHTAEFGVAAHWKYKIGDVGVNLAWLENLQYQNENIEEFYELVKNDLFSEDISVFSPKGDVFTLPRGAVALDFAYAVHTDIGNRAKAAYINKQRSTLLSELKNGDIVRIETVKEPILRCSWIDAVKTSKAKEQMRILCRQKFKEINAKAAINILASELRTDPEQIKEWIEEHELTSQLHRIATEINYLKEIKNRYLSEYRKKKGMLYLLAPKHVKLEPKELENFVIYTSYSINSVEFDYCCHPKRGDEIVAFKEGSKAIVHHKMCHKAQKLIDEGVSMLYIEWKEDSLPHYKLIALLPDRKGALAQFLQYLSKIDINIISIELGKNVEQTNMCEMEFESNISDSEVLRKKIASKVKIIEFIKSSDAYNR